jgi:hypothetical protein
MTNAVAKSDKGALALTEKVVSLASPKELMEFAATLKAFIVKEKLFTEIQKKNFVEVEGWQFCGAATGILPVMKELTDLSNDKEIKYKAYVELKRMTDGEIVGAGMAICSNKEAKRRNADEYVIASMAQTRATGKAYRNGFGWLMKIAGYEATPAEEMRDVPEPTEPTEAEIINQLPIEEVMEKVKAKLDSLPTHERLRALKSTRKMTEKSLVERDWRQLYSEIVLKDFPEAEPTKPAEPEQPALPGGEQKDKEAETA